MSSASRAGSVWRRGATLAAYSAICICLASCGLAWTGTTSGPADSIRAGDAQNGKSITLHPGQTLIVTLSSTYWSFQGSSNPQIVASVGAPVASPAPFDQHGVPGSGAGSVSQEYRAVASGTAQVTASRVSCGEAMKCVGASGQYQLTVRVTATSS